MHCRVQCLLMETFKDKILFTPVSARARARTTHSTTPVMTGDVHAGTSVTRQIMTAHLKSENVSRHVADKGSIRKYA